MDRPYEQGEANDIVYFVGTEVEHSASYGKKTLFVVGIRPFEEILHFAVRESVEQVYLAANQSYDKAQCLYYTDVSSRLIEKDFYVTIDVPIEHLQKQTANLPDSDKLILMVSCKVPSIDSLPKNTVLKIDDIDFGATNKGVWCHNVHSLKSADTETTWDKYTQDKIVAKASTLNDCQN